MQCLPAVGDHVRYHRYGVGIYVCRVEEIVVGSSRPLRLRPILFAGQTLRSVSGQVFRAGMGSIRGPAPMAGTARDVRQSVG